MFLLDKGNCVADATFTLRSDDKEKVHSSCTFDFDGFDVAQVDSNRNAIR